MADRDPHRVRAGREPDLAAQTAAFMTYHCIPWASSPVSGARPIDPGGRGEGNGQVASRPGIWRFLYRPRRRPVTPLRGEPFALLRQGLERRLLLGDALRHQLLVRGAGEGGGLLDQFAEVGPHDRNAVVDLRGVGENRRPARGDGLRPGRRGHLLAGRRSLPGGHPPLGGRRGLLHRRPALARLCGLPGAARVFAFFDAFFAADFLAADFLEADFLEDFDAAMLPPNWTYSTARSAAKQAPRRGTRQAPVTRQMALPTSSAIKSDAVRPDRHPRPADRRTPSRRGRGSPRGCQAAPRPGARSAKGTKITL